MIEQGTSPEPQAKTREWLASILLRRGDGVMPRFAGLYARLAERPRRWRRRLRSKLAVTAAGAALLLALAGFGADFGARADAENVITVVNGEVKIANNGKCSIIEAIRNANNQNTGQSHADCAAGNPTGADTIVLPKDGVFTLTEAHNDGDYGPNGLPWVGSAMTIEGNGSTIQRKENGSKFRVLAVGPKGALTLNSVKISGGDSSGGIYDQGGSGIFNQGEVTVQNSTIINNYAAGGSYIKGGGIFNEGTITITNSGIIDNQAYAFWDGFGGGIYNIGTLNLINSVVSGNMAWGDYGLGGGIFSIGTLNITNTSISDNKARGYSGNGGGILNVGTATLKNSIITKNFVSGSVENNYYDGYLGFGGGIDNRGIITIANSSISANNVEYGYGGGIVNRGEVLIISSSISDNTNGGIWTGCKGYPLTGSETKLLRSIVSGNKGFEVSADITGENEYYCYPKFYGNAHNLIGFNGNANSTGFTPSGTDIIPNVPLNAIISPLADNGGPTWTHALPPGSPAIDRAPNNACTAAPVNGVDQRGLPRNYNGAGGASPNECDIGAFEFQPAAPPTATPTATATPTQTPTGTLEPTVEPSPTATATTGPSPTPPAYDWHLFVPVVAADLWN